MKDGMVQKIGVLGMACRFAHMPSLRDFWYYCVNQNIKEPYQKGQFQQHSVSELLVDTVEKALKDAHLPTAIDICHDSLYHISSAIDLNQNDKSIVQHRLSDSGNNIRWHDADSFKGLDIFEKVCSAFGDMHSKYVVLAVLSDNPVPECAVLVLGAGQDQLQQEAYAVLKALKSVSQKDVEKKLKELRDQGLGYIGCFSEEEQTARTKKNNTPGRYKIIPEKNALLPYGMHPISKDRFAPICIMGGIIRWIMGISCKIIVPSEDLRPVFENANSDYYHNFEVRPWIQDTKEHPRLCAVLGPISDVHKSLIIALEEIPGEKGNKYFLPKKIITDIKTDSELVAFSGNSIKDLICQIRPLFPVLDLNRSSLLDIAGFCAGQFSPDHSHRLALVAEDKIQLRELLKLCIEKLSSENPADADFPSEDNIYFTSNGIGKYGKMACLFPGLGFPGLLGVYAEHLKSLCLHFPEVREVFDGVDKRDCHPEDTIPTSQLFFPPAAFSTEDRKTIKKRLASPRVEDYADIVKPSLRNLSSIGVAIANWAGWQLFQQLNIIPDELFGQSLGELSALCASEAIKFDDIMRIQWDISMDPEQYSNKGRLALVGISAEGLEPYLKEHSGVSIAIHVGQEFQILGGEESDLNLLVREFKEAGVWTQSLPYAAIHTPNLTALRPLMEPHLVQLNIHPFSIPVYSGMTCDIYPEEENRIREIMVDNIDHSVRLWQTTRKMYENGVRIFVQVGGGATMYSQARTNIGKDDLASMSLDVDYRSAWCQLNHLCAGLLEKGINVRFTYLFEHRHFDTREIEEYANALGENHLVPNTQTRMPFIGEILKYQENTLIVERHIDLTSDAYIRDHVFVNALPVKPVSVCLPVVPMTISIEMMAEVAACLAPGCGLVGFENIRASQWIGLMDKTTIKTRIHARCMATEVASSIIRIQVAIYSEDYKRPAIEGVVLFAKSYFEDLTLTFGPVDETFRYPLKQEDIYGQRHLFHGPMFQCVAGEVALSGNKAIGELEVLPKTEMFSYQKNPELLTDPALLDGVGQLVGLWAIDHGEYVFPIGLEKLEIYCPIPEVGTKVPVLVEIKSNSARLLSADIEIQDGQGNVWMRIKNWKDWVFRWSKSLYDFRRLPEYYLASQILTVPDFPEDAVTQYISKEEIKDMDIDTLSRFFFHESEMECLSYVHGSKQKWKWLIKRIVAKDALRRFQADDSGRMIHPAGMVIEDLSDNEFKLKHPHNEEDPVIVRVASSEQGAIALVSSNDHEPDLDRILTIIETSADSAEKRRLSWL